MAVKNQDRHGLEVAVDRNGTGLYPAPWDKEYGLEVFHSELADQPELVPGQTFQTRQAIESEHVHSRAVALQDSRRKVRRLLFILAATITLFLMVIAALVAVLVSRDRSRSSSVATDPPITPSTTITASTSSNSSITDTTSLAAIAWADGEGVIQYRVYYQDSNDYIRESAWNSTQATWYVSDWGLGRAKRGTSLAAAVSSYGQSLNIFYQNSAGRVSEWVYTPAAGWRSGTLNAFTVGADASSNLAAIWYENTACATCANSLLLAYQANDGTLHMCDSTDRIWNFYGLNAGAINGTGMALSSISQYTYAPQLRLFYQAPSGSLLAADWVSAPQIKAANISGTIPGWNLNEKNPLAQINERAPMTSFTFGRYDSWSLSYGNVTGLPTVVDVLASGKQGVTSVPWHPIGALPYEPAQQPPAMDIVVDARAVASHNWGSMYAVVHGRLMEWAIAWNDTGTWHPKGPVVTE